MPWRDSCKYTIHVILIVSGNPMLQDNEHKKQYVEALREVAQQHQCVFVDLYSEFLKHEASAKT